MGGGARKESGEAGLPVNNFLGAPNPSLIHALHEYAAEHQRALETRCRRWALSLLFQWRHISHAAGVGTLDGGVPLPHVPDSRLPGHFASRSGHVPMTLLTWTPELPPPSHLLQGSHCLACIICLLEVCHIRSVSQQTNKSRLSKTIGRQESNLVTFRITLYQQWR